MTIDEAIQILESFTSWFGLEFADRDLAAIKLGIEALERVRTGRNFGLHFEKEALPSETDKLERSINYEPE